MQEPITSSHTRRTRKQIEELLSEYAISGCSAEEFCRIKKIPRGTFYKWQSRNKVFRADKNPSAGFAKLVTVSSPGGLFAEVKGIRIYQVVSASYLKELSA